jgi:hypothetical protein
MDWEHGSSGKAPAYQAQGPEFKHQYCKKKKKSFIQTIFTPMQSKENTF